MIGPGVNAPDGLYRIQEFVSTVRLSEFGVNKEKHPIHTHSAKGCVDCIVKRLAFGIGGRVQAFGALDSRIRGWWIGLDRERDMRSGVGRARLISPERKGKVLSHYTHDLVAVCDTYWQYPSIDRSRLDKLVPGSWQDRRSDRLSTTKSERRNAALKPALVLEHPPSGVRVCGAVSKHGVGGAEVGVYCKHASPSYRSLIIYRL